jgi:hypothetical protein
MQPTGVGTHRVRRVSGNHLSLSSATSAIVHLGDLTINSPSVRLPPASRRRTMHHRHLRHPNPLNSSKSRNRYRTAAIRCPHRSRDLPLVYVLVLRTRAGSFADLSAVCGLCDQLKNWKSTAECFSISPIQSGKPANDPLLSSSCSLALDGPPPHRHVDVHNPLIRRVAPAAAKASWTRPKR